MTSTRYLAWGVGVACYFAAVMHRSSLGVAGVEAQHHFQAPAGIISLFVVVQMLVYTAMMVPAGVLLDRYGTRRLVTTGAIIMTIGQVVMAFSTSVPLAILARVLVGIGDGLTFGSVIRLVPAWFSPSQAPLLTQITGMLGQLGQIASAIPHLLLLRHVGWTQAFLAMAVVGLVVSVLGPIFIRDAPPGVVTTHTGNRGPVVREVWTVWQNPGTRLGFFIHMGTCFSTMAFAFMWGLPYMTTTFGFSDTAASIVLTGLVIGTMVVGPVLGILTARHPMRRSSLALLIIALNLVPWSVLILWPGEVPQWALWMLTIGLTLGGPGSAIGFDLARSFLPPTQLGTATGIIIMGGFSASLVAVFGIGSLLEWSSQGNAYTAHDFRIAMAIQLPLFVVALTGLYRSRKDARRWLAGQGSVVPPLRESLKREFNAWRRRHS